MHNERVPIKLEPHRIEQVGAEYLLRSVSQARAENQLRSPSSGKSFKLSSLEYQYFYHISQGASIEQIVMSFLSQGWLVSFRILFQLLERLVQEKWIVQKEIQELIRPAVLNSRLISRSGLGVNHTREVHLKESTIAEVQGFPFFRSLDPGTVQTLLSDARLYLVPAGVILIEKGSADRDLFVLRSGQAAVVQGQKVVSLMPPMSVFGEGGFFLAKPRGADVIATEQSEVVRIRFRPEYDEFLIREKAEGLQKRIWALHGFLNSALFNELPVETFDRFLMLGRVIVVPKERFLIQEGQVGRHFYILVRGRVRISQRGEFLRDLGAGEVLGEVALMVSQGVRTASAITLEECHVIEIEQKEFYQNLAQNLLLAKELEELAFRRWQNH